MATSKSPTLNPPSASASGLGDLRTGILLIVAGTSPFLIGLVYSGSGATDWITATCPFLMATGMPCPFCGGTRAFALASSGDLAFLELNAFWVFAAAGLIGLGLAVIFTRFSLKRFWSRPDNLAVYLVPAVLFAGWAWAIVNRGAIA